MRILQLSDTHLDITAKRLNRLLMDDGKNVVYEERKKLVQDILLEAIPQKCDGIVLTGDIFDKVRPYPGEIYDLIEIIDKVAGYVKFIAIISGNHDEVTSKGSGLDPLKGRWKNVTVATETQIIGVGDQRILLAPWQTPLERIKQLVHKDIVLAYHAGVYNDNAKWVEVDGEPGNVYLQDLINLECKGIMLGHHHGQQELHENILYAGSPHLDNFGEANQEKGFLIWNIEDKITINEVSTKHLSPVFKTFTVQEFLDEDALSFDGYVRVKGEVDEKERLAVIKKLADFKCLDYKIDLETKHKTRKVFQLKGADNNEILKNYFISKGVENIDELIKLDNTLN